VTSSDSELGVRVLVHFRYAVAFVLAVAAGLVYVAYAWAAGSAKVWGVFLTAVGGSGALLQGVRRGVQRAGRRAEAPLWESRRALKPGPAPAGARPAAGPSYR
jgi:hypothetical protein